MKITNKNIINKNLKKVFSKWLEEKIKFFFLKTPSKNYEKSPKYINY